MIAEIEIEGTEESIDRITDEFDPDNIERNRDGVTVATITADLSEAMAYVKENEIPTESWEILPQLEDGA